MLGRSRLFSLFGLRVGADCGIAKSISYYARFDVNQGHQSCTKHDVNNDCADHRECHIGGGFLLIYQLVGHLRRTGTRSDLFED